jgi:hypothetical protein
VDNYVHGLFNESDDKEVVIRPEGQKEITHAS